MDPSSNTLLTLAVAWPRSECLAIDERCGWDTPSGITPDGLVQPLQKCRPLVRISVAVDTRGYTKFLPSPSGARLVLPPVFTTSLTRLSRKSPSRPSLISLLESRLAPSSSSLLGPLSTVTVRAWNVWYTKIVVYAGECSQTLSQCFSRPSLVAPLMTLYFNQLKQRCLAPRIRAIQPMIANFGRVVALALYSHTYGY